MATGPKWRTSTGTALCARTGRHFGPRVVFQMLELWQVQWRPSPPPFMPEPAPHTTGPSERKAWFTHQADAEAWERWLKTQRALEVVPPVVLDTGGDA